jgi:hypothetical protein
MDRQRRDIIRLMAEIFLNEKDEKAKEELDKKLNSGLNDEEQIYLTQCLNELASEAK